MYWNHLGFHSASSTHTSCDINLSELNNPHVNNENLMYVMGWFEGCHKILYIEHLPQNRRTVNVIFLRFFSPFNPSPTPTRL